MTTHRPASGSISAQHRAAEIYQPDRERRIAWGITGGLLLALTVFKSIGHFPILSTVAFTGLALAQLYVPLWRCDRLGLGSRFVGWRADTWRRDMVFALVLCAIVFPPYALLHHLYMTRLHGWAIEWDLPTIAAYFPTTQWHPQWPHSANGLLHAAGAGVYVIATQIVGIALPEETFYRGYLLPQLQTRFAPMHSILGVKMGYATVITSAVFALAHFLGEWDPTRLGPFLPALLFSWQRNATQSVWGAVAFHAACNVFGITLFHLYQPL